MVMYGPETPGGLYSEAFTVKSLGVTNGVPAVLQFGQIIEPFVVQDSSQGRPMCQ